MIFDVKKMMARRQQMVRFKRRFYALAADLADGRFSCRWEDCWPCLDDATRSASFDGHYIYHTAWAARVLHQTSPSRHVDIGSWLPFATLVSAFIPVEFYDYRSVALTLPGLTCGPADITALPFADASIDSISCMHVVEHIGLERYGDAYDPKGDLKAMKELKRVLRGVGGQLLFVVPIGEKARIQYNAHRIYTYAQILGYFEDLSLESFALFTDSGEFIPYAVEADMRGQKYACGCFHFLKHSAGSS